MEKEMEFSMDFSLDPFNAHRDIKVRVIGLANDLWQRDFVFFSWSSVQAGPSELWDFPGLRSLPTGQLC